MNLSHISLTILQEWEAFTGMIVSDVKDGGQDIPSWLEPDRAQAISVLKVFP